jgi:hypothetical protein
MAKTEETESKSCFVASWWYSSSHLSEGSNEHKSKALNGNKYPFFIAVGKIRRLNAGTGELTCAVSLALL